MRYGLGIEIGGTKLQLGLGHGQRAEFRGFWRGSIQAHAGAVALREQIVRAVPELLQQAGITRDDVAGVGIAFGGPVDADRGMTVVSHQVKGWEKFPLVDWVRETLGWPASVQNDADTAAFAEAHFGQGKGFNPVMYVTIGSGIGGGLIINGEIYRGCGAGALEIGHLRPGHLPRHVPLGGETVEGIASGFGLTSRAQRAIQDYFDTAQYLETRSAPQPERSAQMDAAFQGSFDPGRQRFAKLWELAGEKLENINTQLIARAAAGGDMLSLGLLADATHTLGWALAQAITLVNPGRIVLGGGVSLIGEELFLGPVRRACRQFVFEPFADCAEIVPAGLGEEVVVHGAVALAAARFLKR